MEKHGRPHWGCSGVASGPSDTQLIRLVRDEDSDTYRRSTQHSVSFTSLLRKSGSALIVNVDDVRRRGPHRAWGYLARIPGFHFSRFSFLARGSCA